jgi:hypothetical protein
MNAVLNHIYLSQWIFINFLNKNQEKKKIIMKILFNKKVFRIE